MVTEAMVLREAGLAKTGKVLREARVLRKAMVLREAGLADLHWNLRLQPALLLVGRRSLRCGQGDPPSTWHHK